MLQLKEENAPHINSVDAQGNSCLHCAAYRGHKEVAIMLLQNGIDTNIKNNRGQTAQELAKDAQMQQILSVKPIQQLQKMVTRFEGQLLKLSRFLGWKLVWVCSLRFSPIKSLQGSRCNKLGQRFGDRDIFSALSHMAC